MKDKEINKENITDILIDNFNWLVKDLENQNELFREDIDNLRKKKNIGDIRIIRKKCKKIENIIEILSILKKEYINISKQNVEETKNEYLNEVEKKIKSLLAKTYNSSIPKMLYLFEKPIIVNNWNNVLYYTLEELISLKPDIIKKLNSVVKGKNRTYFSYNKVDFDEKDDTILLSNGLYVSSNLKPNSIVLLCEKLLSLCGYKKTDMWIETELK